MQVCRSFDAPPLEADLSFLYADRHGKPGIFKHSAMLYFADGELSDRRRAGGAAHARHCICQGRAGGMNASRSRA